MREKDDPWTEPMTPAHPVLVCGRCFAAVAGAPGATISDIRVPYGRGQRVLIGRVCRVPMGGHRPDALAVVLSADCPAPCGVCGRPPCGRPGIV